VPQTSYPYRLPLGWRPALRAEPKLRRRARAIAHALRAGRRTRERWQRSGLPRWLHAAPYVALAALGAVLLVPGVVPHGPTCESTLGVASLGERERFISLSAVAFGLVAAMFLLSVLAASAQRRAGRPGRPTIVISCLLGAVALAAVISPHAPAAAPVQALMTIDVLGLLVTAGIALAIPAVAGVVAWSRMSGPRSLRAVQISAWTVLLLGLPLIMAWTYLTVTPICLD
jgi:hypothetical protein